MPQGKGSPSFPFWGQERLKHFRVPIHSFIHSSRGGLSPPPAWASPQVVIYIHLQKVSCVHVVGFRVCQRHSYRAQHMGLPCARHNARCSNAAYRGNTAAPRVCLSTTACCQSNAKRSCSRVRPGGAFWHISLPVRNLKVRWYQRRRHACHALINIHAAQGRALFPLPQDASSRPPLMNFGPIFDLARASVNANPPEILGFQPHTRAYAKLTARHPVVC